MASKSVIFLDVDGVLNNEVYLTRVGRYDAFDPESIDQLNRILIETGADIVVSSSWRYMNDVAQFNERFELAGLVPGRVIDVTPMTLSHRPRGFEIAAWLRDHPDVTNWVAVDDDTDMQDLPGDRIVQTTWESGLQREHADQMIAVLQGR